MPFNFGTSLDPSAVMSASYGAGSAISARENRVQSLQARQRMAMQRAEIMAQQANQAAQIASHEAMANANMMNDAAERQNRLQLSHFNAASDRQRQIDMAMLGYQIDSSKARDQFAMEAAAEKMRRDGMKAAAMDQEQQKSDLDMRNWYMQRTVAPDVTKPEFDVPDFVQGPMQNFMRGLDNARISQLPFKMQTEKLMQGIQRGDPAAVREGMQRGLLQFTKKQQEDYGKLQDAMYRLDNDPRLSPSDRAYAQRQIAEKLNRIKPIPTLPHQQQPTIEDQIKQKVIPFAHPYTGKNHLVTIDHQGNVKELFSDSKARETAKEPGPVSEKDFYSQYEKAHSYLQSQSKPYVEGDVIPPGKQIGDPREPTREEVLAHMKSLAEAYRQYAGQGSDSSKQGGSQSSDPLTRKQEVPVFSRGMPRDALRVGQVYRIPDPDSPGGFITAVWSGNNFEVE